jgi:hypothetical protein
VVKHPAINTVLERLKRLEPETQVQMAEDVKRLLDHPGWPIIKQFLDEALKVSEEKLAGFGGIAPYEQITSQQGFYRGLLTASMIPQAVIESGERAQTELTQIAAAMENAHE